MVVKMKCSVCVALIIVCAGLSEAALVSWNGYSSDITDLGGNVNSTPNSWDAADSVWSTTDEIVAATGGQASFKAAIGILPGQRRIAQINAGSDQIFVGGNEDAGATLPPTSPYTTLVGFDTSAFGVDEVLTAISIELRTRPTADTMSLRWFVEAIQAGWAGAVSANDSVIKGVGDGVLLKAGAVEEVLNDGVRGDGS